MRSRRSQEHEAAVSRRLGQLGEDLSAHRAGVRPARPVVVDRDPTTEPWWDDHTRPAASREWAAPAAGPPSGPAPVPPVGTALGGRHAGPRRGWGGFLPVHLAVLGLVVAVGLAATCW